MSPRRRRPWFGEFVVIVLGVLVALGVDDARQFVSDRSREEDLMVRMASDLSADGEDLAGAYVLARRRLWLYNELIAGEGPTGATLAERGPELRGLLEGRNSSAPQWDSLNVPLEGLVFYPDFDLSDDSYREALSTGSLETIRDTELRARILAYYRVARDRGEDAKRAAEHRDRLEVAFATQGIAIGDVIGLTELRERLQSEPMQTELRHARARTLALLYFLEQIAVARRSLLDRIESGSSF